MRILFLCFLFGCMKTVHRPDCSEPTVTPLADDEVSPLGFTALDLLTMATSGWEGVGQTADGTDADVTVEIARATGAASYVHADPIDITTKTHGIGDEYLLIAVTCVDAVEVPVDLAIASEAAAVDIDTPATLSNHESFQPGQPLDFANIAAEVPYDGSDFTLPSDVDTSWPTQLERVHVEMQPDGRSAGLVNWAGTDENAADYVDVLKWQSE